METIEVKNHLDMIQKQTHQSEVKFDSKIDAL